MKSTLKLEEAVMFAFSIFLFSRLDFAWWWFPVLILLPDFSMVGYAFNAHIGAVIYNIGHHKGIALLLFVAGNFLSNDYLSLAGIILFGHASMDRIFGYGLKYSDSFKNTHLGKIGK